MHQEALVQLDNRSSKPLDHLAAYAWWIVLHRELDECRQHGVLEQMLETWPERFRGGRVAGCQVYQ